MYDVVVRGGEIIDGTGTPPYRAELAIQDEKIVRIAPGPLPARHTIHAQGSWVVPGFIDLHGHSEFTLLVDPRAASKVLQGVTTEIVGNCGGWVAPLVGAARQKAKARARDFGLSEVPWTTLDGYLRLVDSKRPAINVGALVGHANLRSVIMGVKDHRAGRNELARMGTYLSHMLEQGAWGMSAGLYYAPGAFAAREELTALCQVLARHHALFSCHMRDEGEAVEASMQEMVQLALETGVKSQIAHIKAFGRYAWYKAPQLIQLVEAGRAQGGDIAADQYPYEASNTRLSGSMLSLSRWAEAGGRQGLLERLADPTLQQRITDEVERAIHIRGGAERILISDYQPRPAWAGRYLDELAREQGVTPAQQVVTMLEAGDGRTSCFSMLEADLQAFMQAPWVAVASDGRALATDGPLRGGHPHPRNFGTFPRVLGHYVRQEKVLSPVEAIRKMTALPAQRLGLTDRGRLEEGLWADVVVVNPATVLDQSTFAEPFTYPQGIEHVLVNGVPTVAGSALTRARAGKTLRHSA